MIRRKMRKYVRIGSGQGIPSVASVLSRRDCHKGSQALTIHTATLKQKRTNQPLKVLQRTYACTQRLRKTLAQDAKRIFTPIVTKE